MITTKQMRDVNESSQHLDNHQVREKKDEPERIDLFHQLFLDRKPETNDG